MPLRSRVGRQSIFALSRWQTVLSTQATTPQWNREDTNTERERERRLSEMLKANSATIHLALKDSPVHASLHSAELREQLKVEDVLIDTFRSKRIPYRQADILSHSNT